MQPVRIVETMIAFFLSCTSSHHNLVHISSWQKPEIRIFIDSWLSLTT